MNFNQVTIEIRPRHPWEAVDLGLLIARRWWWPLMQVWLLTTLPLFVLLSLITSTWAWWLSIALIWWFKPLFERPLLYILGHAVFNHLPATRETMRALPGLLRPQFFDSLLWRRFSPTRSLDLALIQLEGLAGKQRRDRLLVLHQEDSSPAAALTLIGFLIEVFLAFGLVVLLGSLIPSEMNFDWRGQGLDDSFWSGQLNTIAGYIALSLVAPFYVACGFSLYLNRRIKLEGWDIAIAFQRMVSKRSTAANILLLLPLILVLGFSPLPEAVAGETLIAVQNTGASSSLNLQSTEEVSQENAEEVPDQPLAEISVLHDRESARAEITSVLAREDFYKKRVLRYPVIEFKERTSLWDWLFKHLPFRDSLAAVPFALIMELLFWLLVILLIGVVAFRYRHWLATYLPQGAKRPSRRRPPTSLFGLDLSRESLPDNINEAALALWRAQQPRAALALLYRASLSRLIESGLDIEESHTELECLELAKSNAIDANALNYFTELTLSWRRLAYGHLVPDRATAERLCRRWHAAWDATESAATQEHTRG